MIKMSKIYRGQKAVVEITDSDSADVPIGILQDVEVSMNKEVSELFGTGSIKRKDVQQTELQVVVSGTVSAWNFDTLMTLVDYDGTANEINDTSDMPLFTVTVKLRDTETSYGDTDYDEIEVQNAYIEEVPISGSRDEWIEADLEFVGDDVKFTEYTPD